MDVIPGDLVCRDGAAAGSSLLTVLLTSVYIYVYPLLHYRYLTLVMTVVESDKAIVCGKSDDIIIITSYSAFHSDPNVQSIKVLRFVVFKVTSYEAWAGWSSCGPRIAP